MSAGNEDYEREANRVASQIFSTDKIGIQRQPQGTGPAANGQPAAAGGYRSPLQKGADSASGIGSSLPRHLRDFMEPRFETDFSEVREHSGTDATVLNRVLQSRAFTYGHHIWFGEDESSSDLPLLAHELTHVVQQAPAVMLSPKRPSRDASTDELDRVTDSVWHLTVQGFTDAGALGAYLWPAGPPRGVRITPLLVVQSPAPRGLFELSGITYEAIDTMDPSYAKWFFDLGLRPRLHQIQTLRIWFKAFIPQAELYAPPGFHCFKGDNRSYSPDPKAPARMTSEVLLEHLNTATPTMSESHTCGLTRQFACISGDPLDSGVADTSAMHFYNLRYPNEVVWDWDKPYPPAAHPPEITVPATAPVSVDYKGAAADPLVPLAPFVDMWAHIALDLQSGYLNVTGAVDDFPAFEGYAMLNEQYGPFNLFTFDGDDWVLSLVGGANRSFDKTISLGSYAAL